MTSALVLAGDEGSAIADAEALLSALPCPLVALDSHDRFRFANPAAEQFFGGGADWLTRRALEDVVPGDSPLVALVRQARSRGAGVHEHALKIDSPRTGARSAAAQATPLGRPAGWILVTLQEHTLAEAIERHTQSHGATRSLAAVASALAHEIKNPLSGIRGAAQLIEETAGPRHAELTGLIRDETDRLCALVDRMELFTDTRVLENMVRRLAALCAEDAIGADTVARELEANAAPAPHEGPDDNLGAAVERHLERYFTAHGGTVPPDGLYARILREVERPLISLSLGATGGNQVRTARLLGINRNTLRKKIRELDIPVIRHLK